MEATSDVVRSDDNADEAEVVSVELPLSDTKVDTHTLFQAGAGYRFFSQDGNGNRAAQYEDIHSGPTLNAQYNILGRDHKFAVDGNFLSDKDYHGDLTYDYMGAYRLHLRTESLFHNLDHLQLGPSIFLSGTPYISTDINPAERYGLRVEQDLVSLRARFGNYPAHINLNYWRMVKEGISQLRFADLAFEPAGTTNTIYSKPRAIDRETHEGKLGFDAHLGPVDLIYDFTIREFTDHAGIPMTNFVGRSDPAFTFNRATGLLEHNETPDSRFIAHTVKLHTEQTGGIIAAAAYSYGQRTNFSSLSQVSGVNGLTNTLQTAAGDLLYTPCKEFSLAIKFRHQEIDRESPITLYYAEAIPTTVSVLPAIDTTKDILITTLSIRPVTNFTVKGEYRGEITHRDNVTAWNRVGSIAAMTLPDDSRTHRGTVTIFSRPIKGLRIKANYSYTTTDTPTYGISADERHNGQLLVAYNLKDHWGVTTSFQTASEHNDSKSITTLPIYSASQTYLLPRDRRTTNAAASIWTTLLGRLTLSGTVGFLRTSTDQEILFSGILPGSNLASNYTSQAFLYAFNVLFRPMDRLDLSVMFQQVRSFAEFDPLNVTVPIDTSQVKEISQINSVENSVNFKADYQLQKNISCGVAYTYRDYSDRHNSIFDGSVHSVLANLSTKW